MYVELKLQHTINEGSEPNHVEWPDLETRLGYRASTYPFHPDRLTINVTRSGKRASLIISAAGRRILKSGARSDKSREDRSWSAFSGARSWADKGHDYAELPQWIKDIVHADAVRMLGPEIPVTLMTLDLS